MPELPPAVEQHLRSLIERYLTDAKEHAANAQNEKALAAQARASAKRMQEMLAELKGEAPPRAHSRSRRPRKPAATQQQVKEIVAGLGDLERSELKKSVSATLKSQGYSLAGLDLRLKELLSADRVHDYQPNEAST